MPKVKALKVAKTKTSKAQKALKVAANKPTTLGALQAEVYDISGKKQGTISLPKEIFGVKVNKNLLAQALHIYFVNRSKHVGFSKTRSEVRGGGAKPWRQKGTGRARAGSRRSPLWVGGAKALGPKHRNVQLTLPKKMKKAALLAALSTKADTHQIKVINNIEKMPAKTKIMADLFKKLQIKGSALIIISPNSQNLGRNVKLAVRNIPNSSVNWANNLNAYDMIKNQNIFISKEALVEIPNHFKQI